MHFILPKNTLVNLDFLREKYQNEKKINLDEPPSRIGRPIFFGGTDVVTRKKQIQFLEKIQVILRPNLFKEEEIKTAEEWEANLTASRVMIAACLYVQSKIIRSKRNSTLYRLLEDDLGITTDNFLDNEDRSICFLAAKRIIMSSLSAFEDANIALKKAKKEPFSESDWDDFKTFLIDVHISKIKDNPYLNYPVTSITQPLFGAVFAYTGASLGVLAGNSVSNSTKVLASKYQLTAYVGSTLLVFGSAGPAGVALFAPVIAERLINAFCSISMAHILGMSMGIIGQGVGIGIGIPLDLAYQLLRKTCTSISGYQYSTKSTLTGTRIGDGMTVIHGIVIQISPADQLIEGYTPQRVEIKNGSLYMDNKEIEAHENVVTLPANVLKELKAKLNISTDTEAQDEIIIDEHAKRPLIELTEKVSISL